MKYIKVYPIDNFEKLRDQFLEEVNLRKVADKISGDYWGGSRYSINDAKAISKTDKYRDLFIEMVSKPIENYCKEWSCIQYNIHSIWVHDYDVGAKYIHHTHHLTNMSGVVHLRLEDERDCTWLQGDTSPIKEGDVVLFPSMHPHASLETHGKKIVVSFNWNMHGEHNVSPKLW